MRPKPGPRPPQPPRQDDDGACRGCQALFSQARLWDPGSSEQGPVLTPSGLLGGFWEVRAGPLRTACKLGPLLVPPKENHPQESSQPRGHSSCCERKHCPQPTLPAECALGVGAVLHEALRPLVENSRTGETRVLTSRLQTRPLKK